VWLGRQPPASQPPALGGGAPSRAAANPPATARLAPPRRARAQAKPVPRQAYGAAYGHLACQASVVLEPNTTDELAAMLTAQLRAAEAAGQTTRVRATHK
jgi:hypothetical protein